MCEQKIRFYKLINNISYWNFLCLLFLSRMFVWYLKNFQQDLILFMPNFTVCKEVSELNRLLTQIYSLDCDRKFLSLNKSRNAHKISTTLGTDVHQAENSDCQFMQSFCDVFYKYAYLHIVVNLSAIVSDEIKVSDIFHYCKENTQNVAQTVIRNVPFSFAQLYESILMDIYL